MSESEVRSVKIKIKFTSYWLSSTGGSGAGDLDMTCYRDADGFPAMPMTEIRGTLRERAEQFLSNDCVNALFGERTSDNASEPPQEGALRFSGDARLCPSDRRPFAGRQDLLAALFSRLRSTAICEKTGVAKTDSLRTIEVAVPLTLEGQISWSANEPSAINWPEVLEEVCGLTFAFGHGKNDGLGRALVSIEEPTLASFEQPLGLEESKSANRLVLDLHPADPAVFSRQNANLGQQQTLSGPTGSALWGWVIGRTKHIDGALEALLAGKVSFSDAVPLIDPSTPAFPIPANLLAPKLIVDENDRPVKEGQLQPSALTLGRAGFEKQYSAERQAVPLGSGHISLKLDRLAQVPKKHRLRSAHQGGKAKGGALFGYQHLEQVPTGYRTVIERCENVSDKVWSEVVQAFSGPLLLGKARNNGYGGGYLAKPVENSEGFELNQTVGKGRQSVSIWCLSDLALLDDFGVLKTEPSAADFGLPSQWKLQRQDSSVTTRRFAPWDSSIRGHEKELVVVEAGSVFAFTGDPSESEITLPHRVGELGHRGCGLIHLLPEQMPKAVPIQHSDDAEPEEVSAEERSFLFCWTENRAGMEDKSQLDSWIKESVAAVEEGGVFHRAVKSGPSKSQWSKLRSYKSLGKDLKAEYGWSETGLLGEKRLPLSDWVIGRLDLTKNWPEAHQETALKSLIDCARQAAPDQVRRRQ